MDFGSIPSRVRRARRPGETFAIANNGNRPPAGLPPDPPPGESRQAKPATTHPDQTGQKRPGNRPGSQPETRPRTSRKPRRKNQQETTGKNSEKTRPVNEQKTGGKNQTRRHDRQPNPIPLNVATATTSNTSQPRQDRTRNKATIEKQNQGDGPEENQGPGESQDTRREEPEGRNPERRSTETNLEEKDAKASVG